MEAAVDKVSAIVRRISCARSVNAQTRVYHDLGIGGDDAWEMLGKIASGSALDFSGFVFSRYFPDETEVFGEHVAKAFGRRSKRQPLTVQHLASVVELGNWFDPASDD